MNINFTKNEPMRPFPFSAYGCLQKNQLNVNNIGNSSTWMLPKVVGDGIPQPDPTVTLMDCPPYLSVEKKECTAENQVATNTDSITVPLIAKLDEGAKEFIENRRLGDGVNWLWKVASNYFPGADFDLEVLSGEDEDDTVLALRVYGSLPVSEFRNQNHALCEDMRKKGYNTLYEVISIFQRRTHRYERRAISCDSTPFAKAA